MDRQKAHQLVDELFDKWEQAGTATALRAEKLEEAKEAIEEFAPSIEFINNGEELSAGEPEPRVLPEGKRVVRTKSSGDRVYLLDEVKKTRHWVTNPEVLKGLGFEIEDVVEVEDSELLKFQMSAALYRVEQ